MFLTTVSLVLIAAGGVSADDIHVPADFPTIAEALAAADRFDVVVLAPGTYTETHLLLPNGVSLRGASGNPADVVCDGQGDGPIFESLNGRERVAFHGMTFRNCVGVNGGAISLAIRQGADIIDCVFEDNTASEQGGAVYILQISAPDNQSATIVNCDFERNESGLDGGAVFALFAPLLVENCRLQNNAAGRDGGAIFAPSRLTVIVACDFIANTAEADGGAFDGNGRCRISGSTFLDNSAVWGGGAVQIAENLIDCLFRGNSSGTAGGAVLLVGEATNCEFIDNHAGLFGGAIASLGFGFGCLFEGNTAVDAGGALSGPRNLESCTFRNNVAGVGGAIEITTGPNSIIDCEFDGNRATDSGGAVYGWGFVDTTLFQTCRFIANEAPIAPTGRYPDNYMVLLECCETNTVDWLASWLEIDDTECNVANQNMSFGGLKRIFR